jgi:hypothetical protein
VEHQDIWLIPQDYVGQAAKSVENGIAQIRAEKKKGIN